MKLFGFRSFSVIVLFAAAVLVFTAAPDMAQAASSFKYKDYYAGTTVTYSGKVPSFYIDGFLIDTASQPSIINDRSITMCSAYAVFRDGAGVYAKYNSSRKTITFKYDGNTLVMHMNSISCEFNGKSIEAPCEPYRIRYSSGKIYATFVPARFVAETLGMDYTWNQSSTSVTIETPMHLNYFGYDETYSETIGKVSFNGHIINSAEYPSYVLNDNAILCASVIFPAIPGLEYSYDRESGRIFIAYGGTSLEMREGSTLTLINGVMDSSWVPPIDVYRRETDITELYIPGRYVFEALGFYYEWDDGTSKISIPDVLTPFKPDYDEVIIFDASDTTEAAEDVSERFYRQVIDVPVLEGVRCELLQFTDLLYDNCFYFDLPGYYMDYYREHRIINSGEAVIQIQIRYYESSDITRVMFFTRTDTSHMVLGHSELLFDDHIEITVDRPKNLFDKIIVLDAGHGGTDPGTVHEGYNEKDINYSVICNYCLDYFDGSGIKVYLSRWDDTLIPLRYRANISERLGADFFISVHQNSNDDSSCEGTSVYYSSRNSGTFSTGTHTNKDGSEAVLTSRELANLMDSRISQKLSTQDRGLLDENFVVISQRNTVPAVLIEIGFMSNHNELKRLIKSSVQKKAAKCIFEAVKDIYETY